MKLIIVEDEAIVRKTLCLSIPWEQYEMDLLGSASNGNEALELIAEKQPDLVLTDIRMPDMDGLDLIEYSYNLYPEIRFVIISGYSDFEYAQKAMSFGVREYLLKPCSEKEIIDAIQKTMAHSPYDMQEQAYSIHDEKTISKNYIKQILVYVNNNISDNRISLKWLAENLVFMNVDYLSKQFVKQTGVRFTAYLNALRIKKAQELLCSSHITICEVAEKVGLGENPQYFSQLFKKSVGKHRLNIRSQ